MFKSYRHMTKGITRRWIITTFGVILPIVILLIISLSISVSSVCKSTVDQAVSNRINELPSTFPGYTCENTSEFSSLASEYLQNFQYKDNMKVEVINASGRVIISSTGFINDTATEMPDYSEALQSEFHFGRWTGKLETGEKVLAVTKTIDNSQGTVIGAIRYIVSMRQISLTVFLVALIASIVGLIIIAIVTLSGGYFIRSIIEPVSEMRDTAKLIAGGNFSVKVDKMYDDEIGELCDSINEMASELDASEKMKNDFISRVSHELRTPLTAINGWADTMKGGVLDRVTYEKGMNVISHESLRLTKMVEELLDFSKLQSGRIKLQMAKIDLLAEVDEAVLTFKNRARRENKQLIYDEPVDVLPPVYGDSNRLKQVLLNVLDNALKYTPSGGMIGISVYHDLNDDMVKVVIADNGCGISKEDLPRIKKKFYKANQQVDGSGIGLAVADEIISMHKGILDIDSSPGIGTTVTIGVPVYKNTNTPIDEI